MLITCISIAMADPIGLNDASSCETCELDEEWTEYYGEPIWMCCQ